MSSLGICLVGAQAAEWGVCHSSPHSLPSLWTQCDVRFLALPQWATCIGKGFLISRLRARRRCGRAVRSTPCRARTCTAPAKRWPTPAPRACRWRLCECACKTRTICGRSCATGRIYRTMRRSCESWPANCPCPSHGAIIEIWCGSRNRSFMATWTLRPLSMA